MKILSDAYADDIPSSFVMAHAIKDTVQHFGADTSRRLKYHVYGREGKECAIGRFADTDRMRIDGVSSSSGAEFFATTGGKYLPPSMRGLPKRFYVGLISLHDNDSNWGAHSGISRDGKRVVRELISALDIQGAANVIGLTELVA